MIPRIRCVYTGLNQALRNGGASVDWEGSAGEPRALTGVRSPMAVPLLESAPTA